LTSKSDAAGLVPYKFRVSKAYWSSAEIMMEAELVCAFTDAVTTRVFIVTGV
jgi:hypothetical protein